MRDELILGCQETVGNLVRKYNNRTADEDLQSEGMIAVIQCVDRSLADGLTDTDQIMARCNVWARNAILQAIYKQRDLVPDDDEFFNIIEAPEEDIFLIDDVKSELSKKEKEVFELFLQGNDREEIKAKLGIKDAILRRHIMRIKIAIKEHK